MTTNASKPGFVIAIPVYDGVDLMDANAGSAYQRDLKHVSKNSQPN